MMDRKEYFFEGVVKAGSSKHEKAVAGLATTRFLCPMDMNKRSPKWMPDLKNSISHRGKAIQKLADFLLHNG